MRLISDSSFSFRQIPTKDASNDRNSLASFFDLILFRRNDKTYDSIDDNSIDNWFYRIINESKLKTFDLFGFVWLAGGIFRVYDAF